MISAIISHMTSLLTITYKGQMTLSKAILSALGIGAGDKVVVRVIGKRAVLEPMGKGILDIAGTLPKFKVPKGKTVDDLIHETQEAYAGKILR